MFGTIKFSKNWDKLSSPSGSLFTTIRSSNPSKDEYYMKGVGEKFGIMVNGEARFEATLLQVFRGLASGLSGPFKANDTLMDGIPEPDFLNHIKDEDTVLTLILRRE